MGKNGYNTAMDIFLLILTILLALTGLAGALFPALPGVPLTWVALLILGWVSDFEAISVTTLVVTGVLTAIAVGASYVAGTVGAKKFGASRAGIIGSVIGMLAGLTFLPVGLIVGPFLGAVAGELLYGASRERALKAGFGTVIGFLGGTLLQLILGLVLLGYFIVGLVRFIA